MVYWAGSPHRRDQRGSLLLVVFYRLCRPGFRLIGIFAKLAKGAPLPQQVPALIRFYLQLVQALLVVNGKFVLLIELFLFLHQLVNVTEYRLVLSLGAMCPPLLADHSLWPHKMRGPPEMYQELFTIPSLPNQKENPLPLRGVGLANAKR